MTQVGAISEQPRLLLSFDEAGERLSCSGRHVRALVLAKSLNSVRIGRLHRIAASDLEDYVRHLQAAQHPSAR